MKLQLNKKNLKKIKKDYLVFGFFTFLVFLFYGNTLSNGFVLDDIPVIEQNPYVHSLDYLPKVVTGCIWENAVGGCKNNTLHYRPLHTLSYLLTYQLYSSPWIFHLVNLLYFIISTFLLFSLIKFVTKNFLISFLTSLFFIIHPINNEVVSWVAAASDLLFSIFVFLILIYFAKYRQDSRKRNLFLVLVFYFLAMLSKETAVFVIPPLVLFFDLLILKTNFKKIFTIEEIKNYASFLVPLGIYFLMRFSVVGGFAPLRGNREYFGGYNIAERIFAFFKLFSIYLKDISYPYPLAFLPLFKIRQDLLNLEFFGYFLIFVLYLGAIYFLIKRKQNIIAFFLIWFFLFLIPILFLFWAAGGNVYAQRYLFVSSVSFGFLLASLFNYLWRKYLFFKKAGLILLLLIIGVSFLIIYSHNKAWKNNLTFLEANLATNPNAHNIRIYLADELRRNGDFETAKVHYEEVLLRDPQYKDIDHIYYSMGDYFLAKKEIDKAEDYYLRSVTASPQWNYKSYNNLGAIYFEKGQPLRSLVYFCRAFQINPTPEIQANFNNIISTIISIKNENFFSLYTELTRGQDFQLAEKVGIKYKRRDCNYESCFYIFSSNLKENEIILPFLIMAKVFPEEPIKIENPAYNPSLNEIMLEVDLKYKDKNINFIFPTCEGIYYEVNVK